MILRIDAYKSQRADRCSGIVTSRKRKLREFFAVCDNEGPVPQIKYRHPDAPATSIAENRFLEVTDILKYVLYGFVSHFRAYRSLIWTARVV
jgi:chromatin modification-related protein VID21